MNDRRVNSYYYTPHCSKYVVHWVSLYIPPSIEKKRTLLFASSFLFSPFLQTCCLINFMVCVSVGRGTLCLTPRKKLLDSLSFLLCTHTHTPEALVFVPRGPGVLRSQGRGEGVEIPGSTHLQIWVPDGGRAGAWGRGQSRVPRGN